MEAPHTYPKYYSQSISNSEYSLPFNDKSAKVGVEGGVIVKSHSGWNLWRNWIHFAAIVATGALMAINILNLYLMDANDPNTVAKLNAFQFAAKIHEAVLVGSVMLILMDSIRSRLVSSSGVPFGLLLAPILFNDLDWVTRSHFWSCMKPTRRSFPLLALVFAAIAFANVAGPLSAITAVPRPGFSQSQPAAVFPSFWNGSAAAFWPDTLSTSMMSNKDCFDEYGQFGSRQKSGCPSGAALGLEWVVPDCTTSQDRVACNVSVGDINRVSDTIFRAITLDFNVNSLSTFASAPNSIIFDHLGGRFGSGMALPLNISDTTAIDAQKQQLIEVRFVGNQELLKPIVKTTCEQLDYSGLYQLIQNDGPSLNFSLPNITWLADAKGTEEPSFLLTFMKNDTRFDTAAPCEGQDCFVAIACSINARWAPLKLWYNTALATLLFQSQPQPEELFESKYLTKTKPVLLKKDWLETFSSGGVFGLSYYQVIPGIFDTWGAPLTGPPKVTSQKATQESLRPSNFTQAMSALLSMWIAEALAIAPAAYNVTGTSLYTGDCSDHTKGFTFDRRICAQDVSHWVHAESLGNLENTFTMVAFTVRSNGFGWFTDSVTVRIALGILLFHGFLTFVYLVGVLAFKRKIATCWSSAPEMLMLAIDSLRAPAFMGSSVRASNDDLWRMPISVMEVDGGERVSLIVGDPLSYSDQLGGPPTIGKKYA